MPNRISRAVIEPVLSRWGAPATYVAVVCAVGLTLVAILTRSPDTRSNFQASAAGYHRTALASFTGPEQYPGLRSDLGSDPATIYVGAGCASCHGLRGEGGIVGPSIWTDGLKTVTAAVREGPSEGMPAYGPDRLSDEQIAAIVTYLKDQRALSPDDPGRKPAKSGGPPANAAPAR